MCDKTCNNSKLNTEPAIPGICFDDADADVKFAENLCDRGLMAMNNGETVIAESMYRAALNLLKKTKGNGVPRAQLHAACNYSHLLVENRQLRKAAKVAGVADDLLHSLNLKDGGTQLSLAVAFNNKGEAHKLLNETELAEQYYTRSTSMVASIEELSLPRDLDLCIVLLNEAKSFFQEQGNTQRVAELEEQAQKFKDSFHFEPFRKAAFRKTPVDNI
ncbi:MAG: hypothetical protein K2X29_14440 [Candidatus Obscuribacterales bacterium]|nr:hypothetical protein [Candidatus Obscuribacterales bacterium]